MVQQGPKQISFPAAEVTSFDQGEGLLQSWKVLQPLPGTIVAAEVAYLLDCFAEEEEVVGPNLLPDLDVRPIQGANSECPIHGELHVAGAGSFQAGRGDLFGEIGGWVHFLAKLDIVIRQENHLKQIFAIRVIVDNRRDPIDEADDQLGHGIAGGGLPAEDKGAGHHPRGVALLDAQILDDEPQGIEVLALVLVDAFHLHVEEAGWIHQLIGALSNQGGQPPLGFQFAGLPAG